MSPLTAAVLKTGLLDPAMLAEMRRFRVPIDLEAVPDPKPQSVEEITEILEQALQSEGLVITRETDLEILRQYGDTVQLGMLHIEVEFDGAVQATDIEVSYGRTLTGDYIIGWKSESIQDMLANGRTYLVEKGRHIFFGDARELFFGERKAFLVCAPATVEDPSDVRPS